MNRGYKEIMGPHYFCQEKAKKLLKTVKFGDIKMTEKDENQIRKIWLAHPNGNMSIYSTLLMVAYGYGRALMHISDELNWR